MITFPLPLTQNSSLSSAFGNRIVLLWSPSGLLLIKVLFVEERRKDCHFFSSGCLRRLLCAEILFSLNHWVGQLEEENPINKSQSLCTKLVSFLQFTGFVSYGISLLGLNLRVLTYLGVSLLFFHFLIWQSGGGWWLSHSVRNFITLWIRPFLLSISLLRCFFLIWAAFFSYKSDRKWRKIQSW